jgi:hypothetical protein
MPKMSLSVFEETFRLSTAAGFPLSIALVAAKDSGGS